MSSMLMTMTNQQHKRKIAGPLISTTQEIVDCLGCEQMPMCKSFQEYLHIRPQKKDYRLICPSTVSER